MIGNGCNPAHELEKLGGCPGNDVHISCFINHEFLLIYTLAKLWIGVEKFLQQTGQSACICVSHSLNKRHLCLVFYG